MKKVFVKTKNVKEFVGFMEELKYLPPNIPKIALVYSDYGLGKDDNSLEFNFYFELQWNFNHFGMSNWNIERM